MKATKAVGGRWPLGSPAHRTLAIRRHVALIDEAGAQRLGQTLGRMRGVVGVVAARLAGQQVMIDVVDVVVPLGVVVDRAAVARRARADRARCRRSRAPDGRGARLGSMARTVAAISFRMCSSPAVDDPVHGIEAQPVEAVLLEPVEHVVDGEVAHRADLVVDRARPTACAPPARRSARRSGADGCPRGRSDCRRRRGTPSARGRAPRRSGA